MEESTRRALVKRLAAIAVAGYVAPKVTTIKSARAVHSPGHGSGPGPVCCIPPCGDGGSD